MTEHDDLEFLDDPADANAQDQPPDDGPDRRDPAFWVERLGGDREARSLVQERPIERAIRAEKMGALYKLLRERWKKARPSDEKSRLQSVLEDRRLFVSVGGGAPTMVSWWGFGSAVHGEQDRDPRDGTYITTLFFTLLFIPVWPLQQHLVARAQGNSWFFLGKVPMSPKTHMWRMLMSSGAGLALLAGVFFLWRGITHDEVHFLNGLPEAVVIHIDDETIHVPADGHEASHIGSGAYEVVVKTADGRVIERKSIQVQGGADLAVYNVLGAAPFYIRKVPYTAPGTPASRGEAVEEYDCLAGRTWVTRGKLDFPFETPPGQIELGDGVSVVTRTHAGVEEGGLYSSFNILVQTGKVEDAAKLASRIAEAFPSDGAAAVFAYRLTVTHAGLEGADDLVERLIERHGDDIQMHRLYQSHHEARGTLDGVLAKYKRAYLAAPDDPRHAYLYTRLVPFEVGVPIAEQLLVKHPDDPWLRRIVAWAAFQQLQFTEALVHYRKLMQLAPEERGGHLSQAVRCLVALGREDDALRALVDLLEDAERKHAAGSDSAFSGADTTELFGLYALLRWRKGGGGAFPTVKRVLKPFVPDGMDEALSRVAMAGWARDKPHFESIRRGLKPLEPAARVARLCIQSRAGAFSVARDALTEGVEALAGLDDLAKVMVACEWVRTDNTDEATELLTTLDSVMTGSLTVEHVRSLPATEGLSENLPLDLRAALLLVASQRVTGERSRALLAEAKRYDVLGRVIAR